MLLLFAIFHLFLIAVNPLPFEAELEMGMNPEELGEYLEGDIVLPPSTTRNGILNASLRWEEGIVPFIIDDAHLRDSRKVIIDAMEEYHKQTCIRFENGVYKKII